MAKDAQHHVIIGRVCGLYGVHGEVKIYSYTKPREQIFSYQSWLLKLGSDWMEQKVIAGKTRGRGLSALLEGIDDREKAGSLIDVDIAINREQLAPLPAGQYYWCDLIGIAVYNQDGLMLGSVEEILETGANDVLVVQGQERLLIPLIKDKIVEHIDMETGQMLVNWSPGFQ